jgi:shikimate dehydrogenase
MRATGAEVVKFAARTNRLSDCLPLLDVGRRAGTERKHVLIGMGERGLVTRVLASRFGSRWTYAGDVASVGQIGPRALVEDYNFRAIGEGTEVYGLVGLPIAHSVSPAMHNAAFRQSGRDAVYLPFPAADVEDFVALADGLGIRGASVTIPYKVPLFERVHEADGTARRIGAVNTVRIAAGRWSGTNTDACGFLRPLRDRGIALGGLRVSILGGGGAARAVAVALAESGAVLRVHARDPQQSARLARSVSGQVGPWPPAAGSWDLLVNCTPIGMHPRTDSPVPADALTGRLVYDLVYNPPLTPLLRDADRAGCRTIGGLEMLVAQAEAQFEWWTGTRPPAGVMQAAAAKRLAEFKTDEDHVV